LQLLKNYVSTFIGGKDKPCLIVAEVAQWSPEVTASALIGGNPAENT
jgi:hypothetical protein